LTLAKPPVFTKTPEDAIILSKELDLDVLLVFTASWCQSCQIMKKDIHNDLNLIENTIVCYIDFDSNKDLAKEFKVRILPDSMIYRNNIEIKRKVGYKNKEEFKQWISGN
jgi:thioredoxin-related protein